MLFAFVIFVILIFIFSWSVFSRALDSNGGSAYSENANHFSKKTRLLNQTEHALYINLIKSLGLDYLVFSKVRIEDFVTAGYSGTTFNEHYGNRSKIKSRHVDFLICDSRDTRPLLAIELDGGSHKLPGRISRDEFVDRLYHQIKLPIKHIHVGSDFEAESKIIKESIKNIEKNHETPNHYQVQS